MLACWIARSQTPQQPCVFTRGARDSRATHKHHDAESEVRKRAPRLSSTAVSSRDQTSTPTPRAPTISKHTYPSLALHRSYPSWRRICNVIECDIERPSNRLSNPTKPTTTRDSVVLSLSHTQLLHKTLNDRDDSPPAGTQRQRESERARERTRRGIEAATATTDERHAHRPREQQQLREERRRPLCLLAHHCNASRALEKPYTIFLRGMAFLDLRALKLPTIAFRIAFVWRRVARWVARIIDRVADRV